MVGRKADGWLPSLGYMKSLTDLSDANAIIDEAAREPAGVRRLLNIGGRFGPPSNQLLSGPPEQWVEQLAVVTLEYGFTGYILTDDDPTAIARFGRDVAPALRELVAAERASKVDESATAAGAGR